MQLEFGYGSSVQTVERPQENLLGVLHAAPSSMNAGDPMRSRGRWRTPSAQHRSMRWPDPARGSRSSPAISRVPCPLIRSSPAFWSARAARRRTPICTRRKRRWTPPSGNTAPPPPSSPCPTAARHCRICRTQAPITAGHNKLKSSRSQMRPAAFSDNMQVQAQTLRPM